jgi:hypothetical protein
MNPEIDEELTTQGGDLRCSGRVGSFFSTSERYIFCSRKNIIHAYSGINKYRL